eukprot:gb/GFBE01066407.1/.p1 GENE.gb/GFBE01066407.1/~~gb/GFBE01066407.1/.p1  ORF type:complete len:232 (+),score=66.10 gb/GFBE01066407.1/:1-696(+)
MIATDGALHLKEMVDFGTNAEEDEAAVRRKQALLEEKDNHLRPGICLDDPPEEFSITVERQSFSTPLGIALDPSDGMSLIVKGIKDGPVTEFNKTASRMHCDVRLFDRIVAVNRIFGDAEDLLKELSRNKAVELLVRRPKEYKVTVAKPPAENVYEAHYRHGIIVEDIGDRLIVLGVTEGIFKEYNTLNWEKPVRKNDRIVEVNGVRGSGAKIAEQLSSKAERVLNVVLEH